MKKPKDKRTKEYKEWKKKQPSEGLGDVIEKVTEATGIKKAVKWLAGEDCGCEKRKEKLNKIWRRNPLCLTESEYNFLDPLIQRVWNKEMKAFTGKISKTEQIELIEIYNRVFKTRQKYTTCASCLRDIADRLRKVYEEYN